MHHPHWVLACRGYLTTQVAGGVWADKYGGKMVLGFGVIWWSIATALTPLAASLGLPALLFARACMGVGEGVAMPAMNNLLSRWGARFTLQRETFHCQPLSPGYPACCMLPSHPLLQPTLCWMGCQYTLCENFHCGLISNSFQPDGCAGGCLSRSARDRWRWCILACTQDPSWASPSRRIS